MAQIFKCYEKRFDDLGIIENKFFSDRPVTSQKIEIQSTFDDEKEG